MPVRYSFNADDRDAPNQGGPTQSVVEIAIEVRVAFVSHGCLVLDLRYLSRRHHHPVGLEAPPGARRRRLLRQIEQLTREEELPAGRIGLEGQAARAGTVERRGQSAARRPRGARRQTQRSRAIVPAARGDGARRRAGAPQEHLVRQRAFPCDARDERRRGDRQAAGRFRRPGIRGAGGEQLCSAGSRASPPPSATRSSSSARTAKSRGSSCRAP